jgi:hypothetical protein
MTLPYALNPDGFLYCTEMWFFFLHSKCLVNKRINRTIVYKIRKLSLFLAYECCNRAKNPRRVHAGCGVRGELNKTVFARAYISVRNNDYRSAITGNGERMKPVFKYAWLSWLPVDISSLVFITEQICTCNRIFFVLENNYRYVHNFNF